MDNSKNNDIFKLISEILEYTEDPTSSSNPGDSNGPPNCRCKSEGGFCGDDPPIDCPEALFPTSVLCLCESDPLKQCPKCPPKTPCVCKVDGGSCGDDTSLPGCDPLPNGTYPMIDCYDDYGLMCNVCPKCGPPVTPTPKCYCHQCGYEAFCPNGGEQVSCGGGDDGGCVINYDCYICITPSSTYSCDPGFCVCDSGSNCDYCIPGVEICRDKHLQTCTNGCIITCGRCEPIPTDTPSPTITNTKKCKCYCADFNSNGDCWDWIADNCIGAICNCVSHPCSGNDCETNDDCTSLGFKTPSPTRTTTSTCPQNCKECGGFEIGVNCENKCIKTGDDYAVCCKPSQCNKTGCPPFNCDGCFHQPRLCGADGEGYPTKKECESTLDDPENQECISCDIVLTGACFGIEPCWCPVIKPTLTPTDTNTPCNCALFNAVEVGHCGASLACKTQNFICPGTGGKQITCDICCTPTPTVTCDCTSKGGAGSPCFELPGSCISYKEAQENSGLAKCNCQDIQFSCGVNGIKTCTCAQCEPITPTPSPSPSRTPTPSSTPTCVPPDGCCLTPPEKNFPCGGCVKCRSWANLRKNPNNPPSCGSYECYTSVINGLGQAEKPLGYIINGKCRVSGFGCTLSTVPISPCDRELYLQVTSPANPGDGTHNYC
jgi:hypothetical protein